MSKDFGKLTTEQFREFVAQIPGLLSMLQDMNGRLANTPADKFASIMPGGYGLYSYVYELPFANT